MEEEGKTSHNKRFNFYDVLYDAGFDGKEVCSRSVLATCDTHFLPYEIERRDLGLALPHVDQDYFAYSDDGVIVFSTRRRRTNDQVNKSLCQKRALIPQSLDIFHFLRCPCSEQENNHRMC